MEDQTSTTVFVVMGSEENAKAAMIYGFSQVLYQAADFQITLNSFNMKQEVTTCFTIPRINPILFPCIED
ncbi:hypothetical protein MKX03_029232 [Papaver bracteatum]|nr:hypothetical protein MKX03_029232 [Papaver bracteatum]